MKLIRHKLVTIVMLCAYCVVCSAVNLDSLKEKKRNEMLLSMAKDVVMRYGPDYYREDPEPIIGRALRTNDYKVVYLPKPEEKFDMGYAATVYFDNETGLPSDVIFGNGIGKYIQDGFISYIAQKYYGKKKYNGIDGKKLIEEEVVDPIVYQTISGENKKIKISSDLKLTPIPKDTGNIRKRLEYKGSYMSGGNEIKMYKILNDTIK